MRLGRTILALAGGGLALWGGSKLYNRMKQGPAAPANAPTSTNNPAPGTSTSPTGDPSTILDSAGNSLQAVQQGGDLTGSQPGDTSGLYTTAGSGDTSAGTSQDASSILDGSSGDSSGGSDTSGSDTSSSDDGSSILDDASSLLDASAILG